MATQKKGSVMHVYKLDTRGHHHHPPSSTTAKKPASRSWGLLKRSKTYRETDVNQEKYNNYEKEEKKEVIVQEPSSRKSVSAIEGGMMNSVSLMGRRSVGNTAEMNVEAVAAVVQVRVLVTDMPAFMQIHAFRCARQTFDSLEKFSPKQIALNLKKEFDKVYGPAWHCIVGSNFGSFVTHATGCFLYFSMEKLYILVFKTKVKKNVN